MADIKCSYAQLADKMKTSYERGKVTTDDIIDMKSSIVKIQMFEDLLDNIDMVYHMLRYLRNICIECKNNQNLIINGGLVNDIKILMELIFNPTVETLCGKEYINKIKLVSIQFLGNLVVQNNTAIKHVWENCFPTLFFTMMSNFDGKGKDYVCMVIYNCLRVSFNLTDQKEECWLLQSIIDHCNNYTDVEWGLLVIELVISSDNFKLLYEELLDYPTMRASLLDILFGYLADDGCKGVKIPESNLIFLSNQFETKSSCIMLLANNTSEELLQECQLFFKILSILSTATGYIERYGNLRGSEKLLRITIGLLKQICSCTEPVVTGKTSHDDQHPMFDFKRNLVKMIGNMCYKNKNIQDKVREFDGIIPVLNCCGIDERNPYLMQWAIFTIRTICEGNLENQKCISGLENHGVVSNLMSETNVSTTLENGKIKISSNLCEK